VGPTPYLDFDGTPTKMKVHPGILMKTKGGRFQVSRARYRGAQAASILEPEAGVGRKEKYENEGSSGDVDENKGWQVSGVRCQEGEK